MKVHQVMENDKMRELPTEFLPSMCVFMTECCDEVVIKLMSLLIMRSALLDCLKMVVATATGLLMNQSRCLHDNISV